VTGPTTVTISGSVNPGAEGHLAEDDTTYYIEYGGTTAYGKQTPFPAGEAVEACRLFLSKGEACPQGVAIVGEGTSTKTQTVSLDGLEPGTTYHYRVVATNLNNAEGLNTTEPSVYGAQLKPQVVYGQDKTFTTTVTPPTLSGLTAQSVSQNGATITATLNPQALATRYELQLGATHGQLQQVASGNVSSTTALSLPVASLTPGTTYYYKLTATNPDDTENPVSAEGSFTTAAAPTASTPGSPPALIPYQTIAELNAKEALEDRKLPNPVITKTLTKAEKLKKALKACKKDHSKTKRQVCERAAHEKYQTGSKHKK
jgi:hypothetical protein